MIAIMGMSATGKTEIVKELQKHNFEKIITYTTRPKREGETENDYHFVSIDLFNAMKDDGDFVETRAYETYDGVWQYGSERIDYLINDNSVIILTPSGVRDVKKAFEYSRSFNMFTVLVNASYDVRLERLRQRGDNSVEIIRRMRADEIDFNGAEEIADLVVTNNGALSIEELSRYILQQYRNWRWNLEKSRKN